MTANLLLARKDTMQDLINVLNVHSNVKSAFILAKMRYSAQNVTEAIRVDLASQNVINASVHAKLVMAILISV